MLALPSQFPAAFAPTDIALAAFVVVSIDDTGPPTLPPSPLLPTLLAYSASAPRTTAKGLGREMNREYKRKMQCEHSHGVSAARSRPHQYSRGRYCCNITDTLKQI